MNFTREEMKKAIELLLAIEANLCKDNPCNEDLNDSIALLKAAVIIRNHM